MTNDTERYKICLECVEGDRRWWKNFDPNCDDTLVTVCIQIEEAIKNGDKWLNPFRFTQPENGTCSWCVYVLEHIVLSGSDNNE